MGKQPLGLCRKPKISFDSIFKKQNLSKFDIPSDSFPTETVYNLQFKLKVAKMTLMC